MEPFETYEQFAQWVDYSLLAPELTEDSVLRGCAAAARAGIACVLVRPSDVEAALRAASGAVTVGSVVDYPYGFGTTASKLYAARDLLRRGAREIETPINLSKLVSRQFQYLEAELLQMAQACRESGAVLKVSAPASGLTEELQMLICRILRRAGCDYVSVGSLDSLPVWKTHARERLRIKAGAPLASLEDALSAIAQGCGRVETSAPESLRVEWEQRASATPGGAEAAKS